MGDTAIDINRLLKLGLRVLSALCGAIAGLLALRLLFRLMIANPANAVSTVVYAVSRPFLFPWERLWPLAEIPGLVVEQAALVSLGVYFVLGLVLGFLGLRREKRASASELR